MNRLGPWLCLVLVVVVSGCDPQTDDPLAEIYDLRGVTISEELQPALAAGLAALGEPSPKGPVVEDIATYYRLTAEIDHPDTRQRGGEALFERWQQEPDNFLWMQLASNNKHLLRSQFDYTAVYDIPLLSDTTSAAWAFLQGLRYYGKKSRGHYYDLATPFIDELDPINQVWLARKLAMKASKSGDNLAGVELLLEWLPVARATGGKGMESAIWRDLANYLKHADRLNDALYSAVMSVALANHVSADYQALLSKIAIFHVLEERGEYSAAKIQLEKCLASARGLGFVWLETVSLNLAAAFSDDALGDIETALVFERQGLALSTAMDDSFNIGNNLFNIAYNFMLLGQLDSCGVYIDRTESWLNAFGDARQLRAFPFGAATYYVHIGEYAVADSLIQVARGQVSAGALADEKARFLLEQIQACIQMGQVDLAYRSISQLREFRQALQDELPDQNLVADFEIATADLLARQGEFQAAAAALGRARVAIDTRGGEGKEWAYHRSAGELALLRGAPDSSRVDFEKCLVIAEHRNEPGMLADSRFLLGTVLLESGRPDEARQLFKPDDGDSNLGQRFRTRLSTRLYHAISFSREGRHEQAIGEYRQLGASFTPYTPEDLQARLQLELGRSLLATGQFKEAEKSLFAARQWLDKSAKQVVLEDFRLTNRTIWRELTEALVGMYIDRPGLLDSEAAGRHTLALMATLRQERAAGRALPLVDLSFEVSRNEAWLVFFEGEERSFRWLVANDIVQVSELPGKKDLGALVAPVVSDMSRPQRPVAKKALFNLSALLFNSLTSAWTPGTTLYLTTDGLLGHVPWANLPLASGQDDGDLIPALAYGPICETPLQMLGGSPPPQVTGGTAANQWRLLALGNDDFITDGMPGAKLPTLRYAQAEIEKIAAIWPTEEVETRVGKNSFWGDAGNLDLRRYDVIHIATHAQISGGLPERSTIRLAAGKGSTPLSISGVAELEMGAELVYLSCCETARSVSGSDGMDSFAGACLQAGARSVIATTQRIDDEAASEFATLFYRHWLGGKTKAEALRAAQLELQTMRPAWSHPYFWASYRLIGDGS